MGMFNSTYHFYGVHVPVDKQVERGVWLEADRIDNLINDDDRFADTGVSYVTAGPYDDNFLFLCVSPERASCQVDLGEFAVRRYYDHAHDIPRWDELIKTLARVAGYGDLGDPGWVTVPDMS